MAPGPSLNARLYGTEEGPAEARRLHAGSLSAILEDGALRWVSIAGREAIRGIAFVVRDRHWGTYRPRISGLAIDTRDAAFRVEYRAECGDETQRLEYRVAIGAAADGTLVFTATGRARTPFLTSRAGFVVLHPAGVAGAAVTVTHADGSSEQAVFPELISPSQPFRSIRALRHEAGPGVFVTCTMEGDEFEMEDQRNWTDASFKTYLRPLSRPHPYTLVPGAEFVQRVSLEVEGTLPRRGPRPAAAPVAVRVTDEIVGALPALALAVDPDHRDASLAAAGLVRRAGVRELVCAFDPSAGHDAGAMALFRALGERCGAGLTLEAVLPLQDEAGRPTADRRVLAADVEGIRRVADAAGVTFARVSVSPACYRKSWQPDGAWPSAPPLEDVYAEVRRAFPDAEIGGGMHAYFTEFNRFPPPADAVDFVTHSTCPIVHAGDDRSVMESLQALPWVFASVRSLAGNRPYRIGPTAIGMRFNPYGAATMCNPGNTRGAMVTVDPRQRGLFNAAWTLGYVAQAAYGDVAAVCLSAVAGPFGIAGAPQDDGHPVFPVYHVIAGLAPHAGAALRPVRCADPATVAALALETVHGPELWLANLTAMARAVELEGLPHTLDVVRLDSATFERSCAGPGNLAAAALEGSRLSLDAYAVLRILPGER